ncbi:MAG: N-acetylmuramoyl-L-alanine amidase [Clostridiales bacterium]|nr:N-acetylmuramoyl-L-alanine amidase [Clostridiales bacterium]
MTIIEKNYGWSYALTPRSLTTHLILHHAATLKATAEGIHSYHLSLGWAGIAYHYFVAKSGEIYRGRPENMRGGHTSGMNHCSIGICFEGNFEIEEMSKEQIKAGAELVADIVSRYPDINTSQHKDFGATACPGKNFPFELITMKEEKQGGELLKEKTEPEEWAKEAAEWACESGLFLGDGQGNFNWHNSLSRQELALILMRFNKLLNENPA